LPKAVAATKIPETKVQAPPARTDASPTGPAADLLHLHRVYGNSMVQRMVERSQNTGAFESRMLASPAPGASVGPRIQPKLTINAPGDSYEQEAERVSEQVMRMPETQQPSPSLTGAAPGVQRKCACGGTCADCRKDHSDDEQVHLQREPAAPGAEGLAVAPPAVQEALRSPGQPLDAGTRGFMEPRFGHDFSTVRVHADSQASASAQAVQARAYTVGPNIVFASGQYAPQTQAGQRLLAHELTHVVQQERGIASSSPPGRPGSLNAPAAPASAVVNETSGIRLSRQPDLPSSGLTSTQPAQVLPKSNKPSVLTDDQRKLIRTTLLQLAEDGGTLFRKILSKIRSTSPGGAPDPLSLEILRAFAQSNPRKFRELLLQAFAGGAASIGRAFQLKRGWFQPLPADKHARQEASDYLDLGVDALHLAETLPEAAWLMEELDRRYPGFRKAAALLGPVKSAGQELFGYLKSADETTDPASFKLADPARLLVLTVALGHGQTEAPGTHDIQERLLVSHELRVAARTQIQEIDKFLLLYRLAYETAANQLEEVNVLVDIRKNYQDLIFEEFNFYITPLKLQAKLQDANRKLADWRGIAADQKLELVKTSFKELKAKVLELNPNDLGFEGPGPGGFVNPYAAASNELDMLTGGVLGLAEDLDRGGPRKRDQAYLNFATGMQRSLQELAVKWQLLTFWRAAFLLAREARYQEIGNFDDHHRWWDVAFAVIREVKEQYAHPNYADLAAKTKDWKQRIDALLKEINDTAESDAKSKARRRFWTHLAIAVVVIVITRGVVGSGLIGGLELSGAAATVIGAGAVTAATALGNYLVLQEPIHFGDLLIDFEKNVAFGFLFQALNLGFLSFGRFLFPGRDLAQLVIVLGGEAAVGTAINLAMTIVETGHMPEDMELFLYSSAVLAGTGMLLGGTHLRNQLRRLNKLNFIDQFDSLRKDGAAIFDDMQKIGPGGPGENQHSSLKGRLLRVLPGLEDGLRRMASNEFSDADLNGMGLSRPRLNRMAQMLANYAKVVRESTWSAPSGGARPSRVAGGRALPAPAEVIPGLVPIAPGDFEYNPNHPGEDTEQVTARLRGSGYTVTDTGGGILRLTGRGLNQPLLLTPGPASVPAPALAKLVVAGEKNVPRGIRVLRAQSAAPSLEFTLTSIAAGNAGEAREILQGIGQRFRTDTVNGPAPVLALKGIAHFLEIGGKPGTLATVLRLGGEYGTDDVQAALGRFATLHAADLVGVEAILKARGTGPSGTDSIVGIALHFPQEPVFAELGAIAPATDSGLGELVKQLASTSATQRAAARDTLLSGRQAMTDHPGARLRFPVNQVRAGAGATAVAWRIPSGASGVYKSYSSADLDQIVATTPDIRIIRQLGANMVQGSRGSLLEKWSRKYALTPKGIGPAVPRLRALQKDNGHINFQGKASRSSDGFLTSDGQVWDMKFYLSGGEVDWEQHEFYKAMVREGLIVTPDQQHHQIKSINYLFQARPAAEANLHLTDTTLNVHLWYIDDTSTLTLLR
jgi:hypothetical protein